MRRGKAAEMLPLEDYQRTSAEAGLPRAGIKPSATIREGVNIVL
jgi:hypothetical protein